MQQINDVKQFVRDKARDALDHLSDITGYVAIRDRLIHPTSDDCVTLDICGYRQTNTFSCAVTAGLMVLHTFRPNASVDRFYKLVNPNPATGAGPTKLVGALRKCGIGVSERVDLKWRDVQASVVSGFPIVILVKSKTPDVLHWVVIYGIGRKPNRVFIAGNGLPWFGKRTYYWQEFQSIWRPKGFGLICWGR